MGEKKKMRGSAISSLLTIDVSSRTPPTVWVFAYGSLIWNPGFKYEETIKGYARGFARRFYQGNTHHRGDAQMPGRVVTLIEDKKSNTSGLLYRLTGLKQISSALKHLHEREVLNGYEFAVVPISFNTHCPGNTTVIALTCIASTDNEFYLGPGTTTEEMAVQIHTAKGRAGPNSDYLFKLAEHVRELFPTEEDEHLFELERHVRIVLQQRISSVAVE
uniref:glutathione-specific gamma-glutamylcyclotransferase n=1 Tax=Plectus sambesii TaxID=2011161 RepID=A0A914V034_9BILA